MLLLDSEFDRFILKFRLLEKLRENPLFFNELMFGFHFYSKQKEILFAVRKYKKIAVYSCNNAGKTFTLGFIFHWLLQTNPYSIVLTVSPTFQHLEATVWRTIHWMKEQAKGKLAGEPFKTEWIIKPYWYGLALSPSQPERAQGFHSQGGTFIIVDEASNVDDKIYEALESLLTQENTKMILLGNPIRAEGYYYRTQFDPTFYKIRITAFDTPNFTGEEMPEEVKKVMLSPEWVEDVKRKYGENSNYYRSRVLALFPQSDNETLFTVEDIQYCMSDEILREKKIPTIPKVITCDIATERGDNNVFIFWEGYVMKKIFDFGGVDTMKVVGKLVNAIKEFEPEYVVVDATGVGRGVYDRLMELKREGTIKCEVYGVNFSEKPFDPKFANIKAEFYFNLANFIRNHEVKLIDDERLKTDLLVQEAIVNSKGQIQMIDKKKIVSKLGRSPDYSDATALRFVPSYKKVGFVGI